MTRLEELTLQLADDNLTATEFAQLRELLADRQVVALHVQLLQVEAGLRAQRKAIPVSEPIIERLKAMRAFGVERTVMEAIKALPPVATRHPREATSRSPTPLRGLMRSIRGTRRRVLTWTTALAASIALLVGLSVWLFPPANNEPTLIVGPGTRVTFERGGQATTVSDAVALAAGDVLRTGDTTGSNAITLHYGRERTSVLLFSGSELKVLNWGKGKRLELREGRLEASVARQRPFQPMRVSTPQAEARVLGTRFALIVTTNSTRVDVTEGRVRLTRASDSASVKVGAGYYAIAATNVVLSSLPQTGAILREYWTNIPGTNDETLLTRDSRFPDHPDGRALLTRLEVSPNWGENFGDRICGYLHPPTTGAYSFFISGDAGSQLRLSRNDDPESTIPIAWAEETDSGEWTKSASQRSVPLTLTAGKRYYLEVLRHCGMGPDHLAVAWQPPGGRIEVIPGEFLSPFKPKN